MGFTHPSGKTALCMLEVVRREHVSPHIIRVTLGGAELAELPRHGFDHWCRLFLPNESGQTDYNLPNQIGMVGYLKFLRIPSETRPTLRNYTIREHRPEALELDIDFVVHGDHGPASRFAQSAEPGTRLALLDQERGYVYPEDTGEHILVGDETAMPAILGILRDLPRDARGAAIIEVPEDADRQEVPVPEGVRVTWIDRSTSATPGGKPGLLALAALRGLTPAEPARVSAYICGEQELAAEGRRHLVSVGVPKPRIAFVGYWRAGRAAY